MSAQSIIALTRASEIRRAGQRYRHELAELGRTEGRRRAAELLRDPPEAVARLRLGYFLTAINGLGPCRTRQFLISATIHSSGWDRRIGPLEISEPSLTARQRLALAAALEAA